MKQEEVDEWNGEYLCKGGQDLEYTNKVKRSQMHWAGREEARVQAKLIIELVAYKIGHE